MGPELQFSDELHAMKYRQLGENFRSAMNRVALAMADDDGGRHYHQFREILLDMRFLPAGRIQSAMGASRDVTALNCYVSGTIPDSYVSIDNEHQSSIMHRALEAAQTMRMGGGIGYDFSTLRPRGDLIRKLQSHSSGPVSFMHIYDAVCRATASSGHRRGAQMGVLRIDHPDIIEFIGAKQNTEALTGFNVSVAVTDEFMQALEQDTSFDLRFGGTVYRTVGATELWEQIMRSTWDWAEPGVLFIDTINRMNNLYYCEEIRATNPCGEQPLPPFGACLLGSFNLLNYVHRGDFEWERLVADVPVVVRAMDNVIDRARYPLQQQQAEAVSKRRMGLGVTALANAAETMGYPYATEEFLNFEEAVLSTIKREAYRASARLAQERGAFAMYDRDLYCEGAFIKTLDEETQDIIWDCGMRNSHLTSIAPTGTISMTADNVSSSIEPVFAVETQRPVNTPDGAALVSLPDCAWQRHGTQPRLASEVTADEHVAVLCVAARHVDSAVSKTINCDSSMPWEDFREIYQVAWENGAKGVTTFNSDGQRAALLTKSETSSSKVSDAETSCTIDPASGRRSCE